MSRPLDPVVRRPVPMAWRAWAWRFQYDAPAVHEAIDIQSLDGSIYMVVRGSAIVVLGATCPDVETLRGLLPEGERLAGDMPDFTAPFEGRPLGLADLGFWPARENALVLARGAARQAWLARYAAQINILKSTVADELRRSAQGRRPRLGAVRLKRLAAEAGLVGLNLEPVGDHPWADLDRRRRRTLRHDLDKVLHALERLQMAIDVRRSHHLKSAIALLIILEIGLSLFRTFS